VRSLRVRRMENISSLSLSWLGFLSRSFDLSAHRLLRQVVFNYSGETSCVRNSLSATDVCSRHAASSARVDYFQLPALNYSKSLCSACASSLLINTKNVLRCFCDALLQWVVTQSRRERKPVCFYLTSNCEASNIQIIHARPSYIQIFSQKLLPNFK
jgi:hypothetical protein